MSSSNALPQTSSTSTAAVMETRAKELESLYQIGKLLDTGLDKASIAILLQLLENGVHPEALADVVMEIRQSARS